MATKFDTVYFEENRNLNYLAIGALSLTSLVVGVYALSSWFESGPKVLVIANIPGVDGTPLGDDALSARIDMVGVFASFEGVASELPGAWTQFRGADSDNISKSNQALASTWGADGPEMLWKIEVGEGYAAPAVLNGRVYLLDYDMEEHADAMRCLSLDDGEEIWRRSYKVKIKRNHGMSRTIPAVTEKYIVTIGPKCHVVCLDTETGDFRWGIDLQRDYGTAEPLWYTGQCPIIVNDQAIIAPAGTDTLMMAVDCESGEVAWKTPNPHGWAMSHASIIPMRLLGKQMYVYAALGGLVGVSAEGEDVGQILWEERWGPNVVAPSPVQATEDIVFMTAGYGKGNITLKISESGGVYSTEVLLQQDPTEGLACEQQTPIHKDGLLYAIMPKDAGALKGQFACYRLDGTLAWSSGQGNRFGLGPFLLADDKFFVLSDDGVLTMLDATKSEYVQLAQAEILHGHDAWGPLALAGSRLLLRDMNEMACVELGLKE